MATFIATSLFMYKVYCNALIWRGLGFTSDTLWDINIQVA